MTPPSPTHAEVSRWAEISGCGRYRYVLGRQWGQWGDGGPLLGWVMLNPSTADAEVDDPTIRRCMGFAREWGYGGILVGNVHAYRATDPRDLDTERRAGRDVDGPDNRAHLIRLGETCPLVVCAWGARVDKDRAWRTRSTIAATNTGVVCLGRTKAGAPRHPLYVPASTPPEEYR